MHYDADTRSVSIVRKTTFPISKFVSLGQRLSNFHDAFSNFIAPMTIAVYVREKAIMGHGNDTDRLYRVAGVSDVVLWKLKHADFLDLMPSTIKKIVTGAGRAQKDFVAKCLIPYVGQQEWATDDESDAVATGLAFLIREGYIDDARKPDV